MVRDVCCACCFQSGDKTVCLGYIHSPVSGSLEYQERGSLLINIADRRCYNRQFLQTGIIRVQQHEQCPFISDSAGPVHKIGRDRGNTDGIEQTGLILPGTITFQLLLFVHQSQQTDEMSSC